MSSLSTNMHVSVSENGVKQGNKAANSQKCTHNLKKKTHTRTQLRSSSCLTSSEHITLTHPLARPVKTWSKGIALYYCTAETVKTLRRLLSKNFPKYI